jgi:formylglycine-generating enzyme required for sulfatase activity
MPRLQALLECVGRALCDKARRALQGQWPFADVINDVAKLTYDATHRKLPGDDLRQAVADAAAVEPAELDRRLGELCDDLAQSYALPYKQDLIDYLKALPQTVRQMLRRPSDPAGTTAPAKLVFNKSDDLLPFLPPRKPRFHVNDQPPGLDHWTLTELFGLGECSEVWKGTDPDQPAHSPAALKFATDPETRDRVRAGADLFQKVFDLNEVPGIVPLRSVYLESDPPCLEAPFVYGYDLAGVMDDWKWQYDAPKPEAALKLVRRLAMIVGEAHGRGVVHRDLKPSNILLHPSDGSKKFTIWVTDFGWGQIESVRSLELARGAPRGEQVRLALRGAATTLYASPQQSKKEAPAPTDDVHALGVIWYQLLKRDPSAAAPVGHEWEEEFRPHGLTDSQVRVMEMCLSTRPDKRPKDAAALAELLAQVTVAPPTPGVDDGSKVMSLKGLSGMYKKTPAGVAAPAGRAVVASDAAANTAAALLSAAGAAAPAAKGGPSTAHVGSRLVRNSVGMTLVRVPAGSFVMGTPEGEFGHRDHESPPHPVKFAHPFFLAVHPVSQNQYEMVTGSNPARFTRGHGGGHEHPVEHLSWKDSVRFCELLSSLPEEVANHRFYRLPTEAEWEYACRAGTTTAFHMGDRLSSRDAIFNGGAGKHSGKTTAPVGTCPPNAWGLHDMHGNVQEWVGDWYEEYYYFDSPPADPPGPPRGTLKVVRGGCYSMFATECRSAARRGHDPASAAETIGFRVVLAAV